MAHESLRTRRYVVSSNPLPPLVRWLEPRKDIDAEERLQRRETELAELRAIREVAKRLAEEKPELAEAYRMVGLLSVKNRRKDSFAPIYRDVN
jgi:hypothetical protein